MKNSISREKLSILPEFEFLDAINQSGITPPDNIIADGKIHRFSSSGKARDAAGWYVLFLDSLSAGAFGCWRSGIYQTWRANIGRTLTARESSKLRERTQLIKMEREREFQQQQRASKLRANELWKVSTDADAEHPYLIAKGVQPHGLRQRGEKLLVPLVDGVELVNLQTIDASGNKRFLVGGRVSGVYSPLGAIESGKHVYICEGWATGASIFEATGTAVACAMNAGNLLPAGKALKNLHPDATLIIAGDDDRQTPGNPGRSAAVKAAESLHCGFVLPEWPEGAPPHLSDFNDLQQWRAAQ